MKRFLKINHFFNLLLILFFFLGSYLSLTIGITHDEHINNYIWEINKNKIQNIFLNANNDVSSLNSYLGYYGISFNIFSFPFEYIINSFFDFSHITEEGKKLLIKHFSVFLLFIVSALYFKKIITLITGDKNYGKLTTIFYLTYPYLFGHSLFNIKDIPFMSIWLISTYYLIIILKNLFYKSEIKSRHILLLSFFTSFLISLRVSGVLIFIEYLIFLIFYLNIFKFKFKKFIIDNYKILLLFFSTNLIFLYSLNPSYWNDPYIFIESIKFMSQHVQTVCTITLGECMKAQNLPATYLLIWFFFKLPIIILGGFLLFPFVEKKIFKKKNYKLFLGPIILTIVTIILLLIILNVNLYDEIRQVLFLIPLFLICSLIILYFFNKKFSSILIVAFSLYFIIQNIKIFPYNYIWLNNFTSLINVNKNFELDYWGVSTKKIAEFLNEEKIDEKSCIISNRNNGIEYFIKNQNTCFKKFDQLHKKNIRPFYVAFTERFTKKGTPNNCTLVYEEKVKINFTKENLILAKVFKCD